MRKIKDINLAKVQIQDGFWSERQRLIAKKAMRWQTSA